MDYTVCSECRNCDNSSKHPAYWLCTKHKRAEGFGFVTVEYWDNAPPFLYCKNVNGGFCPLFERREDD